MLYLYIEHVLTHVDIFPVISGILIYEWNVNLTKRSVLLPLKKKCSVMYIYIRDIKSCMRETTYRAKNIKVIISYSSITPFENNEEVIPQSLF